MKAWLVGDDDGGYLVVKAETRGQARFAHPFARESPPESWLGLCAIRKPRYDELPADEADRQWRKDMIATYGPEWGEA